MSWMTNRIGLPISLKPRRLTAQIERKLMDERTEWCYLGIRQLFNQVFASSARGTIFLSLNLDDSGSGISSRGTEKMESQC